MQLSAQGKCYRVALMVDIFHYIARFKGQFMSVLIFSLFF
ncbi:hypothetical protein CPS_2659 [Colwellia psychrerythraea 34H]|uniref:Uncharacterized protein n=1 Tax=Colwellia psychrerythraea (strain 34H / ATCC BAA-681) TaxID=167879 RepID=Q480Z6_COLP3|nr:hypothetical protein CPS_2659 [Colwellia psychrerythraea 34H]